MILFAIVKNKFISKLMIDKEVIKMMMNMSIECDVKTCKYHHEIENYCTKDVIKIIGNDKKQNNTSDCASFKMD